MNTATTTQDITAAVLEILAQPEPFRQWLKREESANSQNPVGFARQADNCPIANFLRGDERLYGYSPAVGPFQITMRKIGLVMGKGTDIYPIPEWASAFIKVLDDSRGDQDTRVLPSEALETLDYVCPQGESE